MASTINADNGVVSGTSGLKYNPDNSGVIQFQTSGVTTLTLDTSKNAVFANSANVASALNIGANALTVGTSLYVVANGNVGLGKNDPGVKLHLYGPLNEILRLEASNTSYDASLRIHQNNTQITCLQGGVGVVGGGTWLATVPNSPLVLGTNNTPRLYVVANGHVGIGSSDPWTKLEIKGPMVTPTTNFKTVLSINSTDAQGYGNGAGITLGGMYDSGNPTTFAQIAGIKENNTSGNYGGLLALYTRVHGGGLLEGLRITSEGKVYTANTTTIDTGYAPFQRSYVNNFTNLGTTPQSVNYSGGAVFIAHCFLGNVLASRDQASFTIYGGRDADVAHRYTGYSGGNCTLTETSEGVFSITGLGDGVTYTLTIGTGSPNMTLAASSTQTGTTTLALFCISANI